MFYVLVICSQHLLLEMNKTLKGLVLLSSRRVGYFQKWFHVIKLKIFVLSWSGERFRFVHPSQERVIRGGGRVIVQLHPDPPLSPTD